MPARPAISDPGFELVRACAAAGLEVVAVPGPCALVAALSISALPTDRFCFEGFLPARAAARRARLDALAEEPRTLVFYESPHRVREMLEDCVGASGAERAAAVAREITKLHETLYRGSLAQLSARAAADADFARGEIVLVIAGARARARRRGGRRRTVTAARSIECSRPLLGGIAAKQAAHLAAQISASARQRGLQARACS